MYSFTFTPCRNVLCKLPGSAPIVVPCVPVPYIYDGVIVVAGAATLGVAAGGVIAACTKGGGVGIGVGIMSVEGAGGWGGCGVIGCGGCGLGGCGGAGIGGSTGLTGKTGLTGVSGATGSGYGLGCG